MVVIHSFQCLHHYLLILAVLNKLLDAILRRFILLFNNRLLFVALLFRVSFFLLSSNVVNYGFQIFLVSQTFQ
jgi:hypothetical protein